VHEREHFESKGLLYSKLIFFLDVSLQQEIVRFYLFELIPTLPSYPSFGYWTNRDFLLACSQNKLLRRCSHNPENPAFLEAELRGIMKP